MHPFCHLLLKATRVDPPPFDEPGRIQQFLKNRRSEAHLTQADLAEKLGVCKKTLWNWEAGLTKPTRKLQRILASLSNQ
jgi:DNA-binding XRE family transcriptional regulator